MNTKLLLLAPLALTLSGCVTINIGTEEPIKAEIDMNLEGGLSVSAEETPAKPKSDAKKGNQKK